MGGRSQRSVYLEHLALVAITSLVDQASNGATGANQLTSQVPLPPLALSRT